MSVEDDDGNDFCSATDGSIASVYVAENLIVYVTSLERPRAEAFVVGKN
ncbi:MAG: hypothetical protein H0T92_04820 [Pyrinomonadaceae bacterium]|nr:hypothetical protein [Pyrinomonadaceae bacterium]